MALYDTRANLLGTENAFKIGSYIRQIEDQGKKVVKCNIGEPDFPTPTYIIDEVRRQLDRDNTHYCDPQGLLSLRVAIAKHLTETRGITANPERIVVFPGAKVPIGLCLQTYCGPGNEVVYPSPCFPIYESFVPYVGAQPVPVHLKAETGFSFSGEEIVPFLNKKTKMVVLNFPSNPTGGIASLEQLEDIAGVIQRQCSEDIRVFSDEVYEDILFDGHKHHSILSCPNMERVTILVSGVSKSFSWTGGRIGWALFPSEEEAEVFKNLNVNYFSCIPPYNQEGARIALESPLGRDFIRRMLTVFQERRDLVVESLNGIRGINCQKPNGAFYAFPDISKVCENLGIMEAFQNLPSDFRQKTSPSTLFQMFLLFEYEVATLDRKSFGRLGSDNLHYLRLSFATDTASLKKGLQQISAATQDVIGFKRFFEQGTNLY